MPKYLNEVGFRKNTKVINGFMPHYRFKNNLLFLMGKDFWCSKIVKIAHAYAGTEFTVFGMCSDIAPANADKDWVTNGPQLKLITQNPIRIAQWKADGSDIEFVPYSF